MVKADLAGFTLSPSVLSVSPFPKAYRDSTNGRDEILPHIGDLPKGPPKESE